MDKLVSIVIPIYNEEKYLIRCVSSLLRQTYKNIEILLIDDGSIDSSPKICDDLEKKYKCIKTYHKSNSGLGLTRNYGIEKASGDFIVFVDSDDYITDNAIECLMKNESKYNADLIIGNFIYMGKKQPVNIDCRVYNNDEVVNKVLLHMAGSDPKHEDSISCMSCGNLYKKEVFEKYGLKFPSERKLIWEDMAFNFQYIPKCNKVQVIDDPIYVYTFNENSLTHKYIKDKAQLVMNMYLYISKMDICFKDHDEFIKRLNSNFLGHIITCIKIEAFYSKINGYRNTINNISEICANKYVRRITKNNNCCKNIKQKIVVAFIQKNHPTALYLIASAQNKRKKIA